MAATDDAFRIPISEADVRSIHSAYRYHLAGLTPSSLHISADAHNNKLSHMLARFVFQKYMRHNQIPHTTFQREDTQAEPAGRLVIGGRSVRFFIRFNASNDQILEPMLTKQQFDQLPDADDINIFATFIRPKHISLDHSGAYYFLPPIPELHQATDNNLFLQANSATQLWIYGTDAAGVTTKTRIILANDQPIQIPSEIRRASFLFNASRFKHQLQLSCPPTTYIQLAVSDWTWLGINAETLIISAWLSSMQLKRRINDRLSIDTAYRIRYFKTEKLALDSTELRPLPRLLELAKQLDKGK